MYRAASDDGLDFSVPTEAFSITSSNTVTDPAVALLPDGTLLIYYVDFSAASDGDGQPPPDDGPADESDFTPATGAADGAWNVDDGMCLSADPSTGMEADIVRDPTVAVHPAGGSNGYVMVYVAGIP